MHNPAAAVVRLQSAIVNNLGLTKTGLFSERNTIRQLKICMKSNSKKRQEHM